jgi:hypothetical protein
MGSQANLITAIFLLRAGSGPRVAFSGGWLPRRTRTPRARARHASHRQSTDARLPRRASRFAASTTGSAVAAADGVLVAGAARPVRVDPHASAKPELAVDRDKHSTHAFGADLVTSRSTPTSRRSSRTPCTTRRESACTISYDLPIDPDKLL